MAPQRRKSFGALARDITSRVDDGGAEGADAVALVVTELMAGLDAWDEAGEVQPAVRQRLWDVGLEVSQVLAWSYMDLVVQLATEDVLQAAIDWGREDVARIGRGMVEVADAFYDSYWVYDDRAAIEQAMRFGTLAEHIPIPSFMLDVERRLTYANQAFLRAVGASLDSLRGLTFDEILGAPASLDGEETYRVALTTEPGGIRHFELVTLPVRTAVGTEYFGQLLDRTEEVLLESTKTQVTSVISHELRTPLTAVVGYAHLLTDGARELSDAERDSALQVIRTEAEHLLRLVSDLMDFTGLETGRLEIRRSRASIEEVVGAALRKLAGEANAVVTDVIPVVIDADGTRLEQVLVNLLTNALRYGAPPYRVEARAESSDLVIRVSDHGAGVPAAERHRIFDSFYQGSRRHVGTGSGLGLAICKAIVQAHGGTIELEQGAGASFLCRIPGVVVTAPVTS